MSTRLTDKEAMNKNLNAPFASTTDFSKFKFVNTRTKATYICKIHQFAFEMCPFNFWNGHGCSKCGQEKSDKSRKSGYTLPIRKTKTQIISEFQRIHGKEKYDYSKVNYTKNNIKVEIKCKNSKHKAFFQTPNKHLLGRGCPLCANETRNTDSKRSLEEFISASNKKHNNFYDYSESIYNGALAFLKITCPEHGTFKQKANDHLNGHGCKYCAQAKNRLKLFKTTEDIIKRAHEVHGDFYNYSKVNYEGIYNPITIICPIHKEFEQVANGHLRGSGCPKCNKSKGEKIISKILDKHKIIYKEQYKFQECKFKQPLPFDFYLLDHSICIEYQGEQHYVEMKHWGGKKAYDYLKNNDDLKRKFCTKKKIGLIEISYTIPKDKIESFLLNQIEIITNSK
jgi:hypothetical protein